ncbi:MAG: MarR family transcriptional regulator [Verrucomicrobiota bacterium]
MAKLDVEKIGLLLNETSRAWRSELNQRLKPLGLSQGKWTTLVHLARGGDKLTQREVAERIGIEEPTLAGLLDRLQEDGWIRRKNVAHDRRCKTVHLQRKSHAVLGKIFGAAQELRHELISDIPARDLQTCMRVLTQLRDKAQEVSAAKPLRRDGTHA